MAQSRDVALASASREPAHLMRLLTGKLEGIDPGFGFDLLTLEALQGGAPGAASGSSGRAA